MIKYLILTEASLCHTVHTATVASSDPVTSNCGALPCRNFTLFTDFAWAWIEPKQHSHTHPILMAIFQVNLSSLVASLILLFHLFLNYVTSGTSLTFRVILNTIPSGLLGRPLCLIVSTSNVTQPSHNIWPSHYHFHIQDVQTISTYSSRWQIDWFQSNSALSSSFFFLSLSLTQYIHIIVHSNIKNTIGWKIQVLFLSTLALIEWVSK